MIRRHLSRLWLVSNRRQTIIWTNDGLIYWPISVSPGIAGFGTAHFQNPRRIQCIILRLLKAHKTMSSLGTSISEKARCVQTQNVYGAKQNDGIAQTERIGLLKELLHNYFICVINCAVGLQTTLWRILVIANHYQKEYFSHRSRNEELSMKSTPFLWNTVYWCICPHNNAETYQSKHVSWRTLNWKMNFRKLALT